MQTDRRATPDVSAAEYIRKLPASRPFGLIFGVVRPPACMPCPAESVLLPRLIAAIASGAPRGTELRVPADVVLDAENHLVLHPTLAIVLPKRSRILKPDGTIWGAPDVVVELVWPAVSRRIKTTKLPWYGKFGVQECWLVHPARNRIEIVPLVSVNVPRAYFAAAVPYVFNGRERLDSPLLPDVSLTASSLFAGIATEGWSERTRQRVERTHADTEHEPA